MGEVERVAKVRELWDAYARSGLDAMLALVPEDVTWEPHTAGGRVFRTHDELRAHWHSAEQRGERSEPRIREILAEGRFVLVLGQLRNVAPGYISDSPLVWLYCFDADDQVAHASGHPSRARALQRMADLQGDGDRPSR
jgi:hypothetical protein